MSRDDTLVVHIDVASCDMTLGETMREITRIMADHPEQDVWLDGDLYAIVGRRRRGSA